MLLFTLLAVLPGCDMFGFRDWEWHQKLTVTVETPSGEITASAVTVAEWEMPPKWFKIGDSGGGGGAGTLEGEALVLEVAPGRYLFALLKGYAPETAFFTLADPPLKDYGREEIRRSLDSLAAGRPVRELPRHTYPVFATIDDPANPESLQEVHPDHLNLAFGPGVRLKTVTLSVTDEPATKGKVEAALGAGFFKKWQMQFEEDFKKNGPFAQSPFAFQITRNDFVVGD